MCSVVSEQKNHFDPLTVACVCLLLQAVYADQTD